MAWWWNSLGFATLLTDLFFSKQRSFFILSLDKKTVIREGLGSLPFIQSNSLINLAVGLSRKSRSLTLNTYTPFKSCKFFFSFYKKNAYTLSPSVLNEKYKIYKIPLETITHCVEETDRNFIIRMRNNLILQRWHYRSQSYVEMCFVLFI